MGKYSGHVRIFTDASKLSDKRTAVAFVIPEISLVMSKIITDDLAVYTGELVAILLALNWGEDAPIGRYLVCWDSNSALVSIGNMTSDSRQDIVFDIVGIKENILLLNMACNTSILLKLLLKM